MDGVFIRKKTNVWNILFLLCGIFFVFLYVFLNIVDPEASSELLIFLISGILCSSAGFFLMLLNHGAYIHVRENTINARFNWFGSLDCRIDDIEFVLPQTNTLTILLKSGKRCVIMGLENSWALSAAIRGQNFKIETEAADPIWNELAQHQADRKRELRWVFCGIALMFAIIFLTVLLTGGRDPDEFSRLDWTFFAVMCFTELAVAIGTFYAAQRCGKHLLPIEQLKYRLRGAIIAAHPLPTNNTIAVYTDDDFTGRIVVCGFPNDKSVFYCVQEIAGNFGLETVYTSEVFGSADELPEDEFSPLIDITALI
ncbi:MAG: hypothetical protein ACI3VA_06175 [Candidatus Limivicinus sp.]